MLSLSLAAYAAYMRGTRRKKKERDLLSKRQSLFMMTRTKWGDRIGGACEWRGWNVQRHTTTASKVLLNSGNRMRKRFPSWIWEFVLLSPLSHSLSLLFEFIISCLSLLSRSSSSSAGSSSSGQEEQMNKKKERKILLSVQTQSPGFLCVGSENVRSHVLICLIWGETGERGEVEA